MSTGSRKRHVPARLFICAACLLTACVASAPARGQMNADDAAVLEAHNRARAQVGVRPLSWNPRIAATASRYAENLARRCRLEHSRNGLGENLFMGTAGHYSPADGVRSWLAEGRHYDHRANSGHGKTVGHYTQVVWGDSRELGCGYAVGCGKLWMACNYNPPGNYVGQRPY